mmetsp:Transcript_73076/g.225747  ORF Transcript_73076/g.225747 Transcript_73076/m.225747 type:complete len:218 (+) Transcript_73076:488-1141(+)
MRLLDQAALHLACVALRDRGPQRHDVPAAHGRLQCRAGCRPAPLGGQELHGLADQFVVGPRVPSLLDRLLQGLDIPVADGIIEQNKRRLLPFVPGHELLGLVDQAGLHAKFLGLLKLRRHGLYVLAVDGFAQLGSHRYPLLLLEQRLHSLLQLLQVDPCLACVIDSRLQLPGVLADHRDGELGPCHLLLLLYAHQPQSLLDQRRIHTQTMAVLDGPL